MAYTEVSQRSWFSRIGGALKGIIVGLILLVVAVGVLFWNEGRAVKRYKTLKEGGGVVISVSSEQIDSSNEGKLVHVSGRAETRDQLHDPDFKVDAVAIKLIRSVEMYQWEESKKSETKKKLGGGEETVTTYDYEKKWLSSPADSSRFKQQNGHHNPAMPFRDRTFAAANVNVGAYHLPGFLINSIGSSQSHPVDTVPESIRDYVAHADGDGMYLGSNPDSPEIGDMRVRFRIVAPTEVSLVGCSVWKEFHSIYG